MTKKQTFNEMLWLIFQYAKSDRQSFIDAYHGDLSNKWVQNALADIKAIEAIQKKLFDTTESSGDVLMKNAKSVDIISLLAKNIRLDDYLKEIN